MKITGMNSKSLTLASVCAGVFILSSCTELKRPVPNPYLAESQPPSVKELRWSNGAEPKSLDPARANAAPEVDIVRAIYEGLTVTDPKTLDAVPGVASSWSVSDDGLTWTFKLRDDAKWSNGKPVAASDFVRSWKRLNQMGDRAAHRNLLDNIARIEGSVRPVDANPAEDFDPPSEVLPMETSPANDAGQPETKIEESATPVPVNAPKKPEAELNVAATDDRTLVVKLVRPDKEFPRVVTHPIFSPVFDERRLDLGKTKDAKTISNGALRISVIESSSVVVEKSETYWNHEAVALEKITFVSAAKPDDALAAYRDGKVDVVTNTELAPLA